MIANALPRPLTAGSVDNAILRADGTGGTILQNSGLIVDDAVVAYSVTGDAATDVITATGHNFTTNQPVLFSSITGGGGLSAYTVYFVRNISGNTFQLSTTSGGAAFNFTTNINAGSIVAIQANVAILQNTTETDSALVLTPKGTGAFILGPKPDGTATGGNARGARAVDLQTNRTTALQIASGANSVICGGSNNTVNSLNSVICAGSNNGISDQISAICAGSNNTLTGYSSFIGSGSGCSVASQNSSIINGESCSITGSGNGSDMSVICGGSLNSISSARAAFIGGGRCNSVTGNSAIVVGGGERSSNVGNTASGAAAGILSGRSSLADRFCMQSHGAGFFSAQGDAQRARFVMRNKTTTNSAVELFLDGSNTRLTVPSGKIIAFTINIAGVSSTGAAVAHYMRQYCLKNVAGTTTEVYAPITIGTDNAAGTSIALSASDAADALVVSVTGTTSTIWRWVASVDAVEISYGT